MILRSIEEEDVAKTLAIYEPFITGTTVTFENEVPSIPEFYERVKLYQKNFPWLVAEDTNGLIAGYAYASKYRDRIAYQWVAETSVYIHPDYKGKGVAQKLYNALLDILRMQGIYRAYAVIGLPHEESVRFHEKMGFKYFATYKNTGYKLGHWRDTGWWELVLREPEENPKLPTYYPQLDKALIDEILKRYCS